MTTRLLLLALALGMASAQSPGTFTAAGDLTSPRAAHSATLLNNGKVLIAGGYRDVAGAAPFPSAELYDPATGTTTATGSMLDGRRYHTATLLADGRVLIAGGSYGTRAELYDPATGVFSANGDMLAPQPGVHTATLLTNGKVLVAGPGGAAQLYDPATGAFTLTAPYAGGSPMWLAAGALLSDGRVLLIGGANQAWTEIYDPSSNTFTITGSPRGWDDVANATLLTNGKVLFVGNGENDGTRADAELYDPSAGVFVNVGPALEGHEFAASTPLPDGTVLITGNQLPGGNGDPHAEVFSPGPQVFSAVGNMTTPRLEHTATLLPDGTVLVAGGYSIWPVPAASTEIYHPTAPQKAPVLFTLGDTSQAAILHAGTSRMVSASDPAAAGEALEVYGSGLIDGAVIPPYVSIGGRAAEVLFFGNAPGYPGLSQINVRVPAGIAPGPASVRMNYLSRPSNEVSLTVQ